jgi:hypothetical protein
MDAKEALERFTKTKDYWSEIYSAMREDIRFSIGLDHWTDTEKKKYGEENCMTVPILPQFIHQVVNDMRMNTPSINVLPDDNVSSIETAKIFKGLIRNIEYKSSADAVYDTAGEYAVRGGLGFARVDHDYISSDSFLQELKLVRVQNPESVYLDESYVECDGSDAEIGYVLQPISKKDFEAKYDGKKFTSFDDKPTSTENEEINICEVFVKEYETITKQMAEDGSMEDYVEGSKKKTRKLKKTIIRRYLFSGDETLEETTFPGIYIPIVPFHGEEVWVDGKRNLLSLIRQAKDAQRRVNKWASKESQILDMAPVAPIIAPVGSVENVPDGWTAPDGTSVLRYNMFDSAGNRLDTPQRLAPPPVPTSIINAMQGAKESVKEALGMYNASIGQRSNETSGVAIDARKVEGEVATFHFGDNRNRSIQHCGRILVCAIPEVYDTARIVQIIGEEEEPQTVGINGQVVEGQKEIYDLRKGKYEVRVTTGASFTTKRQEAAALMGDLVTKNPALMGVIGDLMFKNMDIAGADAIAARVKKTIPPELLADEEEGEQAPTPKEMQMMQALQAMQAQMQEMGAQLQQVDLEREKLELEKEKLQIERQKVDNESREIEIEAFQARAEVLRPEVEAQPAEQKQMIDPDMPEEAILAMLQDKKNQAMMAQETEAMKAQAEQEEKLREQQMEQYELQLKEQEIVQSQQSTQMILEGMSTLAQQINLLTQSVNAPKQVVTPDGRIYTSAPAGIQ